VGGYEDDLLTNRTGMHELDSSGSGQAHVVDSYKHGKEL
jgi:hypothetical protein